MRKSLYLSCLVLASCLIPCFAGFAEEPISGSVSLGYASKYFSEGRDALEGDDLWESCVEVEYGIFNGAIWYGDSPSQDYDELQVSIGITQTVGKVELSAGLTYLESQCPFDDACDKEIGVSMTVPELPFGTEFCADAYCSIEVEGYFMELSLAKEVYSNDYVNVNIAGVFGVNQGYVSDGHDGANNIAAVIEVEVPLTEQLALGLSAAHSWAIDHDPLAEGDELLVDFGYATVGLSWGW